ncbi:membrane protein [Comamonas phosphati]|nr:membrane protein [Comamonas phosphati]
MTDALSPPSPSLSTPGADVAATRWLAVGSLLALLVLCMAWELWLAPLRPGGSWLFLKALPLAFALVGLLKHRMYTYRWVSLLVWLYFTEGVVRAWSDTAPGRWLALAEVALCLLLFAACAAHVRWRQRAARRQG